ncbi:MAG: VOC family protein [Kineosporiaceae bacterium]
MTDETAPASPPPGLPPALAIVTLGVADVERSAAFYSALGWERIGPEWPGVITWFDAGSLALGLFGWAELAGDARLEPGPPPSGPRYSGVTLAVNVASAPAVDAGIQAIADAGGTIVKPPHWLDMGDHAGYSGYGADPDGHLWEVAFNPAFPLVNGIARIP